MNLTVNLQEKGHYLQSLGLKKVFVSGCLTFFSVEKIRGSQAPGTILVAHNCTEVYNPEELATMDNPIFLEKGFKCCGMPRTHFTHPALPPPAVMEFGRLIAESLG